MKNASTPEEVTSPSQGNFSTHTAAQEQRTLETLMGGSTNTIELRDLHNIMQPAARVKALRKRGHTIHTIRETAKDREGRTHYGVACYALVAALSTQRATGEA